MPTQGIAMQCVNNRQTRFRLKSGAAIFAAMALGPLGARAQAAADMTGDRSTGHVLYVESNIAKPDKNSLFAFDIGNDGTLRPLSGSPFKLDGTGFYDSSFKLGPFDNDQNIIIDTQRNILYAVNGGSNTIAAMRLDGEGRPWHLPGSPFLSHGSTPVSIGLHDDTVLALNSSEDPAQAGDGVPPKLDVLRDQIYGSPIYDGDASYTFPAGAEPTQALAMNTGPFVFTAEFPAGGFVRSYYQDPIGRRLSLVDTITLPLENGAQALPLGLIASPNAPYLYVGFVTTNQVGVYHWNSAGKLNFVKAVAESGVAICWLKTTRNGKYLYAVNTTDHSISVFDTTEPANPIEIQHVIVGGVGGLEEFSLDPEERFLYVVEQENSAASVGKSGKIFGLSIDHTTGKLTLLPDVTVTLPLPPQTRPIGLAIR